MVKPTPTQNETTPSTDDSKPLPGALRCLMGAAISTAVAIALYFLTSSIAQAFAAKPIQSDNQLVIQITIAVRTLVVGISTLGMGIFGLIALGLLGLAVQVSLQRLKNQMPPPSDT